MAAFRYIERSANTYTYWELPMTMPDRALMIIRTVHPIDRSSVYMEARVVSNPNKETIFSYVLKPDFTLSGPMRPHTMRSHI